MGRDENRWLCRPPVSSQGYVCLFHSRNHRPLEDPLCLVHMSKVEGEPAGHLCFTLDISSSGCLLLSSQTARHCSSSHLWDPRGQRGSRCSVLLLKDFPGFKCNPQGVVKHTAVSAALEGGSGISVSSEMITFIKGALLPKEGKKRDSKEPTEVK